MGAIEAVVVALLLLPEAVEVLAPILEEELGTPLPPCQSKLFGGFSTPKKCRIFLSHRRFSPLLHFAPSHLVSGVLQF